MGKIIRYYVYDEETETLTVTFTNGVVYEYLGVPYSRGIGMSNANDKDRYWQSNISRYPYSEKTPS